MSSKEKKKGVVPKLRFPEFRDTGPWEVKRLGEVLEEVISNEQNNELPLYSLIINEGLKPKTGQYNREFLVKDKNSAYIVIKKNQFAYNPMNARFGAIARLKDIDKARISKYYNIFQVKDNNNPAFWEFYFLPPQMIDLYNRVAIGTLLEKRRIYLSDFFKLQIPTPAFSEQCKIADCLSSLDELIEFQTKKLEALKAHKKGLMQQLFPREGETTPRLRFPEFRNAGPWEVKYGNELFMQVSNKKHNGTLPVLAITQEHGTIPREKIGYHISITEQSLKSYKVLEIGDFIISLRTFQGGIEYSCYKGLCSPAYVILRKRNEKVVNEFYRHYFKTERYIRELNRNLEGIRDGKLVSYKQFSEIKLPLPSTTEQQKIADCLSSLDELIELQTKKLEALKAHKKGLMQQLFPQEVG